MYSVGANYPLNPNEGLPEEASPLDTGELHKKAFLAQLRAFDEKDNAIRTNKVSRETLDLVVGGDGGVEGGSSSSTTGNLLSFGTFYEDFTGDELVNETLSLEQKRRRELLHRTRQQASFRSHHNRFSSLYKFKREQLVMKVDEAFLRLWVGSSAYSSARSVFNPYSASAVASAVRDLILPNSDSSYSISFLSALNVITLPRLAKHFLTYIDGSPSLEVALMEKRREILANELGRIRREMGIASGKGDANISNTTNSGMGVDSSVSTENDSELEAYLRKSGFYTADDEFFLKNQFDGINRKNRNSVLADGINKGMGDKEHLGEEGAVLAAALAAASALGTAGPSEILSGSILFPPARDRYLLLVDCVKQIPKRFITNLTSLSVLELAEEQAEEEAKRSEKAKLDKEIGRDGLLKSFKAEERTRLGFGYTDVFQSFLDIFRGRSASISTIPTVERIVKAVDRTVSDEYKAIFGNGSVDDVLRDNNVRHQHWSFMMVYAKIFENLREEFKGALPNFLLPSNSTQSNADSIDIEDSGRSIAFTNSIGKEYFNGMRWGFTAFAIVLFFVRRRLLRNEQRKAFLFCQRMCEKEVFEALKKSAAATVAAGAVSIVAETEKALALSTVNENILRDKEGLDLGSGVSPTTLQFNVSSAFVRANVDAFEEKKRIREALVLTTSDTSQNKDSLETQYTRIFYRKILVHYAHWMFAVADPDPKNIYSKKSKIQSIASLGDRFMELATGSSPLALLNANAGFMLCREVMSTGKTNLQIEEYTQKQIEASKLLAKNALEKDAMRLLVDSSSAGIENENSRLLETNRGSRGEVGEGDETVRVTLPLSPDTDAPSTPSEALAVILGGPEGAALLNPSSLPSALTISSESSLPVIPAIPISLVQQQMLLMLQYSTPHAISEKTLQQMDANDNFLLGKFIKSLDEEGNPIEVPVPNGDSVTMNQDTASSLLFSEDLSSVSKHDADATPLSTRVQEHLARFLTLTCQRPIIIVESSGHGKPLVNQRNMPPTFESVREVRAVGGKLSRPITECLITKQKISVVDGEREPLAEELLRGQLSDGSFPARLIRPVRRFYFNAKSRLLFFVASNAGSSKEFLQSSGLFLMPSVLWHRVVRNARLFHYTTDVAELRTQDEEALGDPSKCRNMTQRSSLFSTDKKFYYNKTRGIHLSLAEIITYPFYRAYVKAIDTSKRILTGRYGKPRIIDEEDYYHQCVAGSEIEAFYSKARQRQAKIQLDRATNRRAAAAESARIEHLAVEREEAERFALFEKELEVRQLVAPLSAGKGSAKGQALGPNAENQEQKNNFSFPIATVNRLNILALLQIRYGYHALTFRDRLRWKKLIWYVACKGVPPPSTEETRADSFVSNKNRDSIKRNLYRPPFGIPINLLLAQMFLPLLMFLSIFKILVANQRYNEIVEDENALLELFNEANTIASTFEEAQHAQRLLIERAGVHFDEDEIITMAKRRQVDKGMAVVATRRGEPPRGSTFALLSSPRHNGNPFISAGRPGGGDAFTSSPTHLFKTNAVNPPSSLPSAGIVVPNDYHTEYLIGKLDPSAQFTTKLSEKAHEKLKSLPLLNASQMTLLSKSQQVEMLQYALRSGGNGSRRGFVSSGACINIDTQRLLSPDFDVDSTTDFIVKDVLLSFKDGFFVALGTSPSLIEVAQPKYPPAWIVWGILLSVFTHV